MSLRIRHFEPAADETAAHAFSMASQVFEHAFEPDRRLDPAVAGEHLATLVTRTAERQGRMFVAEDEDSVIGWAVFTVEQNPVFVVRSERSCGYIAELFVDERLRGRGVGRALIAACEDEARRLGLGHVRIGVLPGNARAAGVYARAGYEPCHVELRKYLRS